MALIKFILIVIFSLLIGKVADFALKYSEKKNRNYNAQLMTNEEAMNRLQNLNLSCNLDEKDLIAVDIAILALEAKAKEELRKENEC